MEAEQHLSSDNIIHGRVIPAGRIRCSSYSSGVHEGSDEHKHHDSLESLPEKKQSDQHCHKKKNKPDIDKRARRKLLIACVLSFSFMLGEIVGGIFAHSLAIVSDAAHLLTDLASFLISLLALYLASRQATKKLSFGWYRAEILGALCSILFLWVVTGVLCFMAVERFISQNFEINAPIMLITAACGVAFNLLMGLTLHPGEHGHSHGINDSQSTDVSEDDDKVPLVISQSIPQNSSSNYGSFNGQDGTPIAEVKGHTKGANINVRAAFIHVLGDLLQSIGVLVAAFIIYFKPEWKIADPICTFLFSVIVLVTTLTIMKDILVVLMEGTPKSVNFKTIYHSLKNIKEVKDIHDLRIWSLSMQKLALSVHLAVHKSADTIRVLQRASHLIQEQFGITETTIQVEEYVKDMIECTHCKQQPD